MGWSILSQLFGSVAMLLAPVVATDDEPPYVIEPPDILLVDVTGLPETERRGIRGEHLVRPDGTISLGQYGMVPVVGLTTGQAMAVISRCIQSREEHAPIEVSVDVAVDICNSKTYCIITDSGYGMGIYRMPLTQGTRVGAAIAQFRDTIRGPVWLKQESGQVFKIDQEAIATDPSSAANLRLKRGDRVYIGKRPED